MGCCCGGSQTETVVLNVEGMSCGHCKAAVEKAVSAIAGVTKVEVDLAAKTASITFAADKVTTTDLKNTITEQGYDVV